MIESLQKEVAQKLRAGKYILSSMSQLAPPFGHKQGRFKEGTGKGQLRTAPAN